MTIVFTRQVKVEQKTMTIASVLPRLAGESRDGGSIGGVFAAERRDNAHRWFFRVESDDDVDQTNTSSLPIEMRHALEKRSYSRCCIWQWYKYTSSLSRSPRLQRVSVCRVTRRHFYNLHIFLP